MKVNVSVEATAQEMREFLGLPNIQPFHDEMLQTMRDTLKRGPLNMEAMHLFKPLLPTQFHSMEVMHKFWEAFSKSGGTSTSTLNKDASDVSEVSDSH